VFSPGGLNNASEMYGTNFLDSVITALEDKITTRDAYGRRLENRQLAIL
jgi:glutathione synthase